MGQYLKRWESNHADSSKRTRDGICSLPFYWRYVVKHRWTVYALRIAIQFILLERQKVGLKKTFKMKDSMERFKHLVGGCCEDAPGVKATLQRGTELANLEMRSSLKL